MGLTLQILTKTYCCNDNKDRNVFNEDLDENDNDDNDDEKEERLIVQSVSSFHTNIED